MNKSIEVDWESQEGTVQVGDAIIEYGAYIEDKKKVYEVVHVFLPAGIPTDQCDGCRKQAIEIFHRTM